MVPPPLRRHSARLGVKPEHAESMLRGAEAQQVSCSFMCCVSESRCCCRGPESAWAPSGLPRGGLGQQLCNGGPGGAVTRDHDVVVCQALARQRLRRQDARKHHRGCAALVSAHAGSSHAQGCCVESSIRLLRRIFA